MAAKREEEAYGSQGNDGNRLVEENHEMNDVSINNCENGNVIDTPAALNIIDEWMNNEYHREMELPVKQFQFWYDAICTNSVIFISDLLSKCDGAKQNLLVNGRFKYDKQPFTRKQKESENVYSMLELPLFIAVYHQSYETIKILIKEGVDVLQQDMVNNNIIHCIVLSSSLNQEADYSKLYNTFVHQISLEEKKKLLLSENKDNLRPLELAAQLNEYAIQECILQTRGVYAHSKGYFGVHELVYYDVTDYESLGEGRCLKSPLWYLTHVTNTILAREADSKFILSPVIMTWCTMKKKNNQHIVWLWFLIRALFHIMVVVASGYFNEVFSFLEHDKLIGNVNISIYNSPNCREELKAYNLSTCDEKVLSVYFCEKHSDLPLYVISAIVFIACCLIFINDVIYEIVSFSKRCCTKNGADRKILKGGPLVSTRFYSNAQSLLAICVIGSVLGLIFSTEYDVHTLLHVGVVFYVGVILLNVWAALFFFQFLPHIGYFVLAVQRMVGETVKFVVIYILFLFGFSEAFSNVLTLNGFCSSTGFGDRRMSLYTTFTAMFNMIDSSEFSTYVKTNFTVGLVHIIYVMLVGVLLLNFLVAIMSDSIISVSDNRTILMILQRLHTSLLLEYTIGRVCRIWYKNRQKIHLVNEEGRLYLPCFILKDI